MLAGMAVFELLERRRASGTFALIRHAIGAIARRGRARAK
jgi:hypothetical protein